MQKQRETALLPVPSGAGNDLLLDGSAGAAGGSHERVRG